MSGKDNNCRYDILLKDVNCKSVLNNVPTIGEMNMPVVQSCVANIYGELISFRQVITLHNKGIDLSNKWFHFYLQDKQFDCILRNPEKYMPILNECAGGIGPDFSMYLNSTKDNLIDNCRTNKALTRIMQEKGMSIVPNAGYGDADTLKWAFDGFPEQSDYAITTQGCLKNRVCKQSLINGLHELARQKHPNRLYVYGRFPDEWRKRFPFEIIRFKPFAEERWGE